MPTTKQLLIAGGEDDRALLAALAAHYSQNGYQVLFGKQSQPEDFQDHMAQLTLAGRTLDAFIYISPTPREGSMLGDHDNLIATAMDDDLEKGLWWIQAACKHMVRQGRGGRIVTLAHIAALVPTERFSYGAAGQLALMNLCRSGIQELVPYNIKINTVFRGFSQSDPAQRTFFEQLKTLHKEDGIPLLEYTQPEEVAKTCYLLTDTSISSFNGAMLTMDSGFNITRKIRYLSPIIT